MRSILHHILYRVEFLETILVNV